jgi:dihydrofolate synthase/folylpolyglutamate synthase
MSGWRGWSPQRAERHLRSLELFGMRFGLDRMRRLMTALGSPQRRFASVHVVGTNGKSSTTRMIAAVLERHGLRTGAYLSPHLISYTERVQVAGCDIAAEELAAAIERAAWAAERVNHTLAGDDHVTQFELLTAAAFWELARREVDVVAVEAGLGGRYDATNVIDAGVCVLTNVGLEHTRWLGPTIADIAAEKLAVVPEGATLVIGPGLAPEAEALARATARERGARLIAVADEGHAPGCAAPPFRRRNLAVARAAAAAHLRGAGIAPREEAFDAAAATLVRGRFEVVRREPLTVFDGAHNPAAAVALAEALPALARDRAVGLVLGVLEDKDAAGMLRALLPHCARAWFAAPPGPRALPPAALLSLARQLGFEEADCEPHPERALAQATRWAQERPRGAAGSGRMVLATGSIYLVGELMQALGASGRPASRAPRGEDAREAAKTMNAITHPVR